MIQWLKGGEAFRASLVWIKYPMFPHDSNGANRLCTLEDILYFSLKFDCTIPDPGNLHRAIGSTKKFVDAVCKMAIEKGIIRVTEDGSYSTIWLVEQGFCNLPTTPAPKSKPQQGNCFLNNLINK